MRADILGRYNRDQLPAAHQQFLEKLISFARLIQRFTCEKSWEQGVPSPRGVLSSLVMGHIITVSDWGSHEVARKENNLALLEKHDYWAGKVAEVDGVVYRSYLTWLDFAIDYSDELTNSFEIAKYEKVLMAKNLDEQIEFFAKLQYDPTTYHGRIEKKIERYGLWEFDF